jgi:hypothetical protein
MQSISQASEFMVAPFVGLPTDPIPMTSGRKKDLISYWQFPFLDVLDGINVHGSTSGDLPDIPFLDRAVYTMVTTLMADHGSSRRAGDFTLQQLWHLLDRAQPQPEEPDQRVRSGSARRIRTNTAEAQISDDHNIIVHPVCPKKTCNFVWYRFVDGELPLEEKITHCPVCQTALFDDQNLTYYKYPRRNLIDELERIFAIPGVEDLCFTVRRRDEAHEHLDDRAGSRVLREQSQGAAWAVLGMDGEDLDDAYDVIRLNLSMDYFRPLNTHYHKNRSVGPLSAVIANLPNALRSNLALTMILGVAPGMCDAHTCHADFAYPTRLQVRMSPRMEHYGVFFCRLYWSFATHILSTWSSRPQSSPLEEK